MFFKQIFEDLEYLENIKKASLLSVFAFRSAVSPYFFI